MTKNIISLDALSWFSLKMEQTLLCLDSYIFLWERINSKDTFNRLAPKPGDEGGGKKKLKHLPTQ